MPKPASPAPRHVAPDHIRSLLQRLRLDWLLHRFPPQLVRSVYMFVNGFITIGLLALLALLSRNPFVFPSLGPTAYLLFFSPLAKSSSPRNTVFGHAIGIVCGYQIRAIEHMSCPLLKHGCEAVADAPFARPFGIPDGFIAAGMYGLLIMLALLGHQMLWARYSLRTLAVLANVLGVFDMARLGAYCFYCLLTTVLSPALLWMALVV